MARRMRSREHESFRREETFQAAPHAIDAPVLDESSTRSART